MMVGLARCRRLAQDAPRLIDCNIEADAFIRHSAAAGKTLAMSPAWTMICLLSLAVLLGAPAARAAEATATEVHAAPKAICLPPNETREEIKARRLLEPFAVLKSAAAQFKAEALSAKLCHLDDEFVYEIALLHSNGRFVHVVMNATTGKFIGVRHGREPLSKM
jgi:hypothetical protein